MILLKKLLNGLFHEIFESRFFLFPHCTNLFLISRKKNHQCDKCREGFNLTPKMSFVAYIHPISTLCTHFFLVSRKKNHYCDKCEERFNLTPQNYLCCVFYHFMIKYATNIKIKNILGAYLVRKFPVA